MTEQKNIHIAGARVNNLKNISVDIPVGKFVVITGVSGSGKSSLAFDTLYAEGQRRYVESMNSYARQFLGRMSKPECDSISGIPPAIAIEQKVRSHNPRSTVGTSTEIYDYMRLLFARAGHTFSPVSKQEVKKHTVEDVVRCTTAYPKGTRFSVLARIEAGATALATLQQYIGKGFSRLDVGGEMHSISDQIAHYTINDYDAVYLLIDRLTVSEEPQQLSRLRDSIDTAFTEGGGTCYLRFYGEDKNSHLHTFSNRFEADGITFEQPSDLMFSFNSPVGACPKCEGTGSIFGIDEKLVIPNTSLSVYDGCVACWRGEMMKQWQEYFIGEAVKHNFPIHKPYHLLSNAEKDLLWKGAGEQLAGINAFFKMLQDSIYKIQNRVMISRFSGKTLCTECHGSRLKAHSSYVKVGGKSIQELIDIPISDLQIFFRDLVLNDYDTQIAKRILTEIRNRINYVMNVGLGYLTLNRRSDTLSGGESQRINLATSLGSALVGSLYILDEPSIGLHPRDTEQLIKVLLHLRQAGNTVVVVEHDPDIMRSADWLIDVGRDAGTFGGEIVYTGIPPTLPVKGSRSRTVEYLTGKPSVMIRQPRVWNRYIEVVGAREHNLKDITVRFPLNVITCVTGVSGSGKSTLVTQIFYRALAREYGINSSSPGEYTELRGDIKAVSSIELIDQNPIGKSSRSNPATYLKVYDDIRALMAAQPLSKRMGYTATHFSFNAGEGRCEECKGEGTITIPMQFMADLVLPCEHCNGTRFKKQIREVEFHNKNIHDILNMTVDEALQFFAEHKEESIVRKLQPLATVGLGYVKLGQSSSTLSGGESQRVKLAFYLSAEHSRNTIFVFDEPTTGLHAHDITKLLTAFDALIKRGHTIVIIEHNLDVIRHADHIIDIGPEGGEQGGNIVFEGTLQQLKECQQSYTSQFLRI